MAKAVKADVLYTGKPEKTLHNVYIVWENETIISISKEKPEDVEEIFEYDKAIVTPAFIDAHSHIGMARAGE
ncbi:MAG TPA: imidazolonepropionase, partial [Desulfurococcaceae archaeon]|nr:imidazolonepropionase [Desulfurococcaceae archaeon]